MKVGTKIVCIDNTHINDNKHTLTMNKIYIVEEFDYDLIYVIDDTKSKYGYMSTRFIPLREKQLNELI